MSLDEYLKGKLKGLEPPKMVGNQPTAYVCKNYTCGSPITEPEALLTAVLSLESSS